MDSSIRSAAPTLDTLTAGGDIHSRGQSVQADLPSSILVVDDEKEVRRLLAAILSAKGYQISQAADGREALQQLDLKPFDLMITDLRMPNMDGSALVRACREAYPYTDVMVLTAYGTIPNVVQVMKLGAEDYLTKPFEVRDLEQKVAGCLSRRRARLAREGHSLIEPVIELGRILSTHTDLPTLLETILDLVQRTFNPTSIELVCFGEQGQDDLTLERGERPPQTYGLYRMSRTLIAEAALPSEMAGGNESSSAPENEELSEGHGVVVPLLRGQERVGALSMVRSLPAGPFTLSEVQLLQVFGSQLGLAVLHARTRQQLLDAFKNLNRATHSTVRSLFAAIETYDQYTHDHSERVSQYAYLLAQRIGLTGDELEAIRVAGLLHDIGKLGIGDETLHKPASLDPAEIDRVRLHPAMGARILSDLSAFEAVVPMVRHHHERYDGMGYPDHLAGNEIPLGARIIAVVDAYDSMTSDRPYRPALSAQAAMEQLRASIGSQFDGNLVTTWIKLVSERNGTASHPEL